MHILEIAKLNGSTNAQVWWMERNTFFILSAPPRKAYFLLLFLLSFFALKSSISIENWLQRAKIVNIFYSNINFSIRKVSDRWRIARYGIWLIFFHISVFHVRSMAAIEKAPMGKWRIETKNDVNLFVPFRFSAVTHSLTHTHTRILPGVFYPGAHLNVIRTQCTALESHIDVNLPLVREWKTLRFWPVNSNKHAIYINFLCHIFIHFGQCGAHLAGLLMWKYKYGHCPCYCFNRIVVLV